MTRNHPRHIEAGYDTEGKESSSACEAQEIRRPTREEVLVRLADAVLDVLDEPPFVLSPASRLDYALSVASLTQGGARRMKTTAVKEAVGLDTLKEIEAVEGGIRDGIPSKPQAVTVSHEMFKAPRWKIGALLERAHEVWEEAGRPSSRLFARAAVEYSKTGDQSEITRSFPTTETHTTDTARQPKATDHGNHPTATTTTTGGGHRGTATGHCILVSGDGKGVKSASGANWSKNWKTPERTLPARNDVYGVLTGVPIEKVYGLEEAARKLTSDGQLVDFLTGRQPEGKWIASSTRLRESLLDWNPLLRNCAPWLAMMQYILHVQAYDDVRSHDGAAFEYEGACTGIVFPHQRVLDCCGLTQNQADYHGITSGWILKAFRRQIDHGFEVSAYSHARGQARVITSHTIPEEITMEAKRVMYSPWDVDDWCNLVSGKSANRRNWGAILRKERLQELGHVDEEGIELPAASKRIRDYLNSLSQLTFAHGDWGIITDEAYERARNAIYEAKAEDGSLRFPTERRRDEELRKLFWMRRYPQPFYKPCARFPRLKADHYNQTMNLTNELRQALYTDRDAELDLEKAHLSSLVPIAAREDIDMPVTSRALEASLDGHDLWTDLASTFDDLEYPEAARKSAKRVYASVYGAEENEILRRICFEYADASGKQRDFDAFRSVLDHPLVEEVLEVRSQLRDIIEERGGLEDASGRFIPLSAWNDVKKEGNRWRGVLAYVAASYEQELMAVVFDDAAESEDYTAWLYQADGCTVRFKSRADRKEITRRVQRKVEARAGELGMITALEVAS